MPKKMKKVSTFSFVSVLAASAIVPVISIPDTTEAANVTILEVVYNLNGQHVALDFTLFTEALNAGITSLTAIQYVKCSDDRYYNFLNFSEALNASNSLSEAINLLSKTDLNENLQNVVKGTIENGNLIAPSMSNGKSVKSLMDSGILTLKPNSVTGQISVLIDSTQLPNELTDEPIFLVLDGVKYEFIVNSFKPTQFEVQNLDYSESELLVATIQLEVTTPPVENQMTLESLKENGAVKLLINPINQFVSVVIDQSKLPTHLKGKSLKLVINGEVYEFIPNPFAPNQIEVLNINFTENEILTATIKTY